MEFTLHSMLGFQESHYEVSFRVDDVSIYVQY